MTESKTNGLPLLKLLASEIAVVSAAASLGLLLTDFDLNMLSLGYLKLSVLLVFYVLTFCASMALAGLYNRAIIGRRFEQTLRISFAVALTSLIVTEVSYLTHFVSLIASQWFSIILMTFLFVLMLRLSFGQQFKSLSTKRKVLVLGAGRKALQLKNALELRPGNVDILGFVHQPGERERLSKEYVHYSIHSISEYAKSLQVDEVVVAVDDRRNGFPLQELLNCRLQGIEVNDLLYFYEREHGQVKLDILDPSWLIFSDGFKQHSVQHTIKGVADRVIAGVMCLLLAPIYPLVYLAQLVRGDIKTGIFAYESCYGRGGDSFNKMNFKVKESPAWFGRLLQSLHLHRIPEFINVLKGEMSLVGPSAIATRVATKNRQLFYQDIRYTQRPGMTGWAQINNTNTDEDEVLQFDLYYVKNATIFLDLVIIFRTLSLTTKKPDSHLTAAALSDVGN